MVGPRTFEEWKRDTDRRVRALETRRGARGMPAGIAIPWTGDGLPAQTLEATGQTLVREEWPDLFAAIGTKFGAGDGSTTFRAPDWRGRTLVGFDGSQTEFNAVGKTGGEKRVVLDVDELPQHRHMFGGDDGISLGGYARVATFGYDATSTNTGTGGHYLTQQLRRVDNTQTDGGQSHNNLQPFSVVRWLITTGPSTYVFSPPDAGMPLHRGTTAERDMHWGVPITAADRVRLANLRPTWFNIDMGWEESYYESADAPGMTVRGLSSGISAGWYPVDAGGPRLSMEGTAQAMSGAQNYVNWAPGSGASWMSHALWGRANAGATWIPALSGRYRVLVSMNYVNGSGTAVGSLRVQATPGSDWRIMQKPIQLLASYGQIITWEYADIVVPAGALIYFRSDAGNLSIGGPLNSFLSVSYLGPALRSA